MLDGLMDGLRAERGAIVNTLDEPLLLKEFGLDARCSACGNESTYKYLIRKIAARPPPFAPTPFLDMTVTTFDTTSGNNGQSSTDESSEQDKKEKGK